MDFKPEKDNYGNPKEGTYEMGIIDAKGNEKPLIKTTTDKAGSINSDFKLGDGEKLYQRSTGESTSTRATRKPAQKTETKDEK